MRAPCPGHGLRARRPAARCGPRCCAPCWNRHRGSPASGSPCCTVRSTRGSAARIVEANRRTAHFMAASTTGLVNARASSAVRAAEQAAAEEASGAGLVEFALVVTATASSFEELHAADAEIGNLAASARLRLRVARGQQAAAFSAALPAGVLPWLHTLVPHELRGVL